MSAIFFSTLVLMLSACAQAVGTPDPKTARFRNCEETRVERPFSTTKRNGFVPGLYVVSSNLPNATIKTDNTLASRNIVCAHMDPRTSGGTIVVPWAAFDKRDETGRGGYSWAFVDAQMAPWITRGQKVNLLVWPAVQKEDQQFPSGQPATPSYILARAGWTFRCPRGSSQNTTDAGNGVLPLPKFWNPRIFRRYESALRRFVARYHRNRHVNYFRFGIGVGAESYPANGATTPQNFCMDKFVSLFGGATRAEKADRAYVVWTNYVKRSIQAFRKFESMKPIIVTVNDFRTAPQQDPNEFPNTVAQTATGTFGQYGPLGLGVQGATTADIGRWAQGGRCNANWCALFEQMKASGLPLQLQTPVHSGVRGVIGADARCDAEKNDGSNGCMATGSMAALIPFALRRGVRSFELYPYEWFVANDKGFTTRTGLEVYNDFGQLYRAALQSASNEVLA